MDFLALKKWILVVVLAPQIAAAQSVRCSEVFDIFSPEMWSQSSLRELADQRPRGGRLQSLQPSEFNRFRSMGDLTPAQLRTLSVAARIAMLTVHGRWNLLVEPSFFARLESSFGNLENWRPKNFLHFALFRKVSPQRLGTRFLRSYKRELVRRFEEFDTNTKLEVLGAEIFHGTSFTIRQMDQLLTSVARSLEGETSVLRFKPVKEFYRALTFLRATQPTFFFQQTVEIESLLNAQLKSQGLSLDQGGTSGAQNAVNQLGFNFEILIRRIDDSFPNQEKYFEFMEPSHLGFFDPVDLYYPRLRLVVEWDGPHHYFRQLSRDGILDPNTYILRPMDRIRDENLRRMGVSVLRWGRHQNPQLETADIEALIRDSNPGVWQNQ